MSQIIVESSPLPIGFCHTSWSTTFQIFASLLSARFSGNLNTINFGSTTPTPENQDKPWVRTTSNGAFDAVYSYYNGFWVTPHTLPVGLITLWDGIEAAITTLDGGEAGAVTETSGPFWERVTAFDGRFPLGVGTLGSGTVVAAGGTGGAETVTLTAAQMPKHQHSVETRVFDRDGNANNSAGNRIYTGNDYVSGAAQFNSSFAGGDAEGQNEAHSNMPPYRGVFFIKRTGRLYKRV